MLQRHEQKFVADYLSEEEASVTKHEFVEGHVYEMGDFSNRHNLIATNALVRLAAQCHGSSCQVFNSASRIRLRLRSGTRFYYPDASIVYRPNPANDSFQDQPFVIVEVISESTRRNDEFEKRDAYLTINSLCVYIRVEQSSITAIADRRTETGFVREIHTGHEAIIPLPEMDCRLPLAELYEDVEFPAASDRSLGDSKAVAKE